MIPSQPVIYKDTALARGLQEYLKQLEKRLGLKRTLNLYLAGGMAVHLYTAMRVTSDIDGEFKERVILPNDLLIDVTLENGEQQVIYFDTNYNSTFALMHEDYEQDAIHVDLGLNYIRLHVLSPVDLVVSKLARFAENDQEDIAALIQLGLTSAAEINARATHALVGAIGNISMLELNLQDTLSIARNVEARRSM